MTAAPIRTPRLVAQLADAFDGVGLDLWAANLRACLQSPTSLEVARAVRAEAIRLLDKPSVRATQRRIPGAQDGTVLPAAEGVDLVDGLQTVLDRINVEIGEAPSVAQPLYAALRDLADDLQLHGHARWLARLRHVALDTSFAESVRMERLDNVICSALTDDALPAGLLMACRVRLESVYDDEEAAKMAAAAFRPPVPKHEAGAGDATPNPRPTGVVHKIVADDLEREEDEG